MTIANMLSLSRLLSSPFILVFFSRKNLQGVIGLWVFAALTDFLDGRMARKRNEISELGKILDPIADKMTLIFSFLSLTIWYALPLWLGLIYISKEILQIAGGIVFFKRDKKLLASNYWGKISTVLFFIGFFLYCFHASAGILILSIGLILSLIAFCTYTRNIIK